MPKVVKKVPKMVKNGQKRVFWGHFGGLGRDKPLKVWFLGVIFGVLGGQKGPKSAKNRLFQGFFDFFGVFRGFSDFFHKFCDPYIIFLFSLVQHKFVPKSVKKCDFLGSGGGREKGPKRPVFGVFSRGSKKCLFSCFLRFCVLFFKLAGLSRRLFSRL